MWCRFTLLLLYSTLSSIGLLSYSLSSTATTLYLHITVGEANVYQQPNLTSPVISQLTQNTVVVQQRQATPRSESPGVNTWHYIQTADKQVGWINAEQVEPLPIKMAMTSKALDKARQQLRDKLSLNKAMQLTQTSTQQQQAGHLPVTLQAEWALFYLQALQKTVLLFNRLDYKTQQQAKYAGFLETYADDIYQSDYGSAGWFVESERFWDLHKMYGLLPIGDRIAWAAATNPAGGECEGAVSCYLYDLNSNYGRYLHRYPQGKHVDKALQRIAKVLQDIAKNEFGGYFVAADIPEDVANFEKDAKHLQITIKQAVYAEKEPILQLINTIMQHYPEPVEE